MKVVIEIAPWKGDHRVDAEDAEALLIQRVLFDGEEIPHTKACLQWEGPTRGTGLVDPYDFVSIVLNDVPEETLAGMSPDDYGLGSTPEECTIIVSSLKIEETVPVHWGPPDGGP